MNLFKKSLVASAVIASLSGCSVAGRVASYAADANDEALKSSEFIICKGSSVGAVQRRYNTPELMEAWRKLCLSDIREVPFIEGN